MHQRITNERHTPLHPRPSTRRANNRTIKIINNRIAVAGYEQAGEGDAKIQKMQQTDPFILAQQFRVALYREFIRAKGCTPQDVWQTWLTMPYDGPGRREILEEMRETYLK